MQPQNNLGIDISRWSYDDLEQEARLQLLTTAIVASKLWLTKRFESNCWLLYSSDLELPRNAEPVEWADHNPDPEIIYELAKWALHQSEIIQNQVYDFLDNPSDQKADHLIKELNLKEPEKLPQPSLAGIILRELLRGPKTIDQLYELEELIIAKRPRAAIRQALRRLEIENKVYHGEELYIYVPNQ